MSFYPFVYATLLSAALMRCSGIGDATSSVYLCVGTSRRGWRWDVVIGRWVGGGWGEASLRTLPWGQ